MTDKERQRFSPWRMFGGIRIPPWLAEIKDLTCCQKMVLAQLVEFSDRTRSVNEIAHELGIHARTVHRALKRLQRDGFIELETRPATGRIRYVLLRHEAMKEWL